MFISPRLFSSIAIPILALILSSCREPVGPSSAKVEGLSLDLTLSPASVKRRDPFEAELVIRNTRRDTVTLSSGCSTIAWIRLYRDGERVSARGTDNGCLTVVTAFQIPPGGELRRKWTITAEDTNGSALPPGVYTFRLDFNVAGLPDLERVLRVE